MFGFRTVIRTVRWRRRRKSAEASFLFIGV
jgi:hypothetical protein